MAADDDARAAVTLAGSCPQGCWWQEVVQSSPDGVLIVEGDTIVYANRAMANLVDTRPGELTGRSVEELVPAEVRTRHRSLRAQFSESPHARPLTEGADLLLRRADGRVVPVDIGLAPLTADGAGLILATVRDVSARRAEQAERARLAQILQIVPDGIIVVDSTTGEVVDVNEAAGAMLGHSPRSLRGMPATRLSATGDPEFLRRPSSELSVQRLRTVGGDTLDCEVHAVAFDGTLGTEVVNVVRDVGPRNELERRARAGKQAFRAVFEHAPVGLAVTRRDVHGVRTIVRTNDAFARMFGYQPHELKGQQPWVLTPSHTRGEEPAADPADDEGPSSGAVAVHQYVRRDGSTLWAEVRFTRLVLDRDQAQLSLVQALDVTERVEADRSRQRQGIVTQCIADVSNAALAHEDVSTVFDRIARGALAATDADAAAIHLWVAERTTGRVAAATGGLAATLSTELESATARPSTTEGEDDDDEEWPGGAPSIGAVLAVPFGPEESLPSGRVVVCRKAGRPPFSPADASELTRLANQSQVALHLAHARDDQQRLMLIEERQRIARDLHDTVIQDMIAMGMEMSSELSEHSDAPQRAHAAERLERLEDMVVSLRRAVFQLRDTSGGRSLAREVTDAVAQASRILPTPPMVTFAGPLELVAADLVDDLIAVLREALANVTRHAGATRVVVSVTVTNEKVLLVVDDDGIGLTGASQSGFGVLSFTERARRHGGSVSVGPGPVGGTRVAWGCPLLR